MSWDAGKSAALALVGLAIAVGSVVARGASATATAATTTTHSGCLRAVVVHREHMESPDGVTRELTYRDRFQRCDNKVYITRIIPDRALIPGKRAPGPHEAPDVAALPRLVGRGSEGRSTLAILDVAGRRVIEVDRGSFETLRFDANFERTASLIDPRSLAMMKPLDKPSDVAGATWLGQETGERYVRVLWDEARRIAHAIESGTRDGSVRDEVRVSVEDAPAATDAPPGAWATAKDFVHVDYADFGD